ncbi:uncharacterized protein DFL_001473 [Arthrobotrys flagrans]|uniref:Peptidase M20 dimerisation domain-containing protein n=1 Tax=Arthrobotrys flagrans TaxID=97331 RepID=A0A437A7Z8_ARTFL|nr:hypothetical protein DFL_001473 [Arthrobotrys flagrans]
MRIRTYSHVLLERCGSDGIEVTIDEGSGLQTEFGSDFIVISTAEKGFLNQKIAIKTPGGYSSIPPKHTSIGIISELVVALESHTFDRVFSDDNPLYDFLGCAAAYAKHFPKDLRDYIAEGKKQELGDALVKWNPRYDADLRTTTAVTTIFGGTKVNTLPELVTVSLSHRIRRGSSISEVTNATQWEIAKIMVWSLSLIQEA